MGSSDNENSSHVLKQETVAKCIELGNSAIVSNARLIVPWVTENYIDMSIFSPKQHHNASLNRIVVNYNRKSGDIDCRLQAQFIVCS